MDVHNHTVHNVHDMGCTQYNKQQSFYMEACSHIGTNRWDEICGKYFTGTDGYALKARSWKAFILFNTSKDVCMFNIYTFKRNLHVHMFFTIDKG